MNQMIFNMNVLFLQITILVSSGDNSPCMSHPPLMSPYVGQNPALPSDATMVMSEVMFTALKCSLLPEC